MGCGCRSAKPKQVGQAEGIRKIAPSPPNIRDIRQVKIQRLKERKIFI